MKPKIKQISAVPKPGYGFAVFGLGYDGKVYVWDIDTCEWLLEKATDDNR